MVPEVVVIPSPVTLSQGTAAVPWISVRAEMGSDVFSPWGTRAGTRNWGLK